MSNELTYPGLVIRSHRVRDAQSKKAAWDSMWGWESVDQSAPAWLSELEQGHTIQPSLFNRTKRTDKDGNVVEPVEYIYKHTQALWRNTSFVCADADYIQGVEFTEELQKDADGKLVKDDDGKPLPVLDEDGSPVMVDVNPDGVMPWTKDNQLSTLYPSLKDECYACVQSVSSMSPEKTPLHRRYRLIFLFDEMIESADHYKQILNTLASKYPIITTIERAPTQPVFGNARKDTGKVRIVGNVLSLSDFPYVPPVADDKPASKGSTPKSKYNATQRKYKDDLDGLIADAKLIEHETGGDGKVRVDCPFNSDHKRDAFVGLDSSGYPSFKCHHNSCQGNGFNQMVKQAGIEVESERKTAQKPNPVRVLKDASEYFEGSDFNVLAMSEHIQGVFRVWSQDSGIYVYDKSSGVYVPGEMDIDQAVREALGSLRKKRYVEEVLADLASTCRRNVPDTSDLIGFKNGVLRLNTGDGAGLGDFSPHSPDNYLMTTFPVAFDEQAPETDGSTDFQSWLVDVLEGDGELMCLLYEVMGSIYHRQSVDMQQGVLLIGEGGTGKSMFLSQVERMVGRNNICARDWGDYGRDDFAFAGLYEKSLALGSDLDVGGSLKGAIKKAITGNTQTHNGKYQTPFDFNPYATWIGSINRFPRTKDKTWGFFRRWIAVPFNKRFDTNSQFEKMKRALWSEPDTMSRIVYDALRSYVIAYQNGKYTVPDSAAALSREMHRAANSVITWLDEKTIPDESEVIDRQVAYTSYSGFCQQMNIESETNRVFYDTLRSQGYVVDKYQKIDGKSTRVVQGFQMVDTLPTQEGTHLFGD